MATPPSGGRKVLRVGILTPVNTLNPRECRDAVSILATAQVFETPFATPRGEGVAPPVLFSGPLVHESERRCSAAVRAGIRFSDGTPLTADLLAASLGRVDDVREQAAVSVENGRVVFELKAKNPRFDLALTTIKAAATLDRRGSPIGTNAYVPVPNAPLADLRLVRNAEYRDAAPIDEIHFRRYPANEDGRPEALMKAVEAGEVDFTNALSRADATEVKGVRKSFQPGNSTAILHVNTERPGLGSPEVRRALAAAIDRAAVTEVSYANPLAFVATSLLPPMMGAHRDNIAFAPDRARAAFEAAPGPKPGRLRLLTVWAPRPYLPHPAAAAQRVADQLRVLGLTAEVVVPRSSEEYFQACRRGDYDLVLGGWIADTPDPADFLEANLGSDRVQSVAGRNAAAANLARRRSPEMDEALAAFRGRPGAETRAAVFALLAEDVPLLPVMYGPTVVVSAWRVKNVEVSPLGVPQFAKFDLG